MGGAEEGPDVHLGTYRSPTAPGLLTSPALLAWGLLCVTPILTVVHTRVDGTESCKAQSGMAQADLLGPEFLLPSLLCAPVTVTSF